MLSTLPPRCPPAFFGFVLSASVGGLEFIEGLALDKAMRSSGSHSMYDQVRLYATIAPSQPCNEMQVDSYL